MVGDRLGIMGMGIIGRMGRGRSREEEEDKLGYWWCRGCCGSMMFWNYGDRRYQIRGCEVI
jgi:hypothetical protein